MTKKQAQEKSINTNNPVLSKPDECGRIFCFEKGILKHTICIVLNQNDFNEQKKGVWNLMHEYEVLN